MTAIDDLTRLQHMRDAAREILDFVAGKSRDSLDEDRVLTLAIVKDLEIIGEAANQVSSACKERYPEIPWIDIISMRNRLVHAYFSVNLDIIWDTYSNDLEPLIEQVTEAIEAES